MMYNWRTHPSALLAVVLSLVLVAPAASQEVTETEPNRGGELDLTTTDPEVARERLTPAQGYELELFASERGFPIGNPVALSFDSRGRMWVASMPSYPQYRPGDPPTDKLVILEDTDGDGKADKHTVFADSLYLAAGFELGDGGAYVAQQPNLVFLRDTDGDDVADERQVVLHGFGTEDSHHAISAFTWGPDGALYFQEGTFLHSQVETPYGPVRLENAGVFRYEPHTEKLEVFVTYPFANPWGHVFDDWGQNFVADASNGSNYFALPFSGRLEYPTKHPGMRVFTSTRVRPTAGAEIVRSRAFPEDVQGNFLITNVIGFQGIKNHRIIPEGSGFTTTEAEPLLSSSDINFRPIDLEFGPDGALYVVDWFNPLIGHMQYSLRDPRRDTRHGRVWRIKHSELPLLEPLDLERLSLPELLDQLKTPELRTRYRVRRELRVRDRDQLRSALERWIAGLDRSDPLYERHLVEALWAHQARDLVEPGLLRRLLEARDHRARAAATRVLRYWQDRVDNPLELLRARVNDPHPLVRLEAVVALSYTPSAKAAEIALEAVRHPMDYYLEYGLNETLAGLQSSWRPLLLSGAPFARDNPEGVLFLLDRLESEEVARVARNEAIDRALLRRRGVPLPTRRAVLADLSAATGKPPAALLIEALAEIDGSEASSGVGGDLVSLLMDAPAGELAASRKALERLSVQARDPVVRQGALAGLLRESADPSRIWRLAEDSPARLTDLMNAATLVPEAALRAQLAERVEAYLRDALDVVREAPGAGVRGRFVRVEQPGCCETLSLAEVEVFSGTRNVAPGGDAEQKSTAPGGDADRAIDGNTSSEFRAGSVSQTNLLEPDAWWELDLGEAVPISSLAIWQRSDEVIGGGLEGFHLRVLDSDRKEVWASEGNPANGQPITFDLGADSTAIARRAALRALSVLPVPAPTRLELLRRLLERRIDQDLAVEGLAELLAAGGAAPEGAAALVDPLVAFGREIPSADRGGESFRRLESIAEALTASGQADAGQRLASALERLAPVLVTIRAVPAEMRFDLGEFEVPPGGQVELTLENPDHMPHNLVITAPGALELVGQAADAMAARPDGFEKQFVPDMPEVLQYTRLLAPGETVTLRFEAPETPGDYPFICSFPGHWITMRGVMKVQGSRFEVQSAPAPAASVKVQGSRFKVQGARP